MWIFMNNAFLSVVQNNGDHSTLLVRGRFRGDIERVFPEAIIFQKRLSDYKYRALVDRKQVAEVMAAQVMSIDYGNFKQSVNEDFRHEVYKDVWLEMYKEQIRQEKINEFKTDSKVLQLLPVPKRKED